MDYYNKTCVLRPYMLLHISSLTKIHLCPYSCYQSMIILTVQLIIMLSLLRPINDRINNSVTPVFQSPDHQHCCLSRLKRRLSSSMRPWSCPAQQTPIQMRSKCLNFFHMAFNSLTFSVCLLFTCRYVWYKNGRVFNTAARSGRYTVWPGQGTLIFIRPGEDDDGYYQCTAQNDFGIAYSVKTNLRRAGMFWIISLFWIYSRIYIILIGILKLVPMKLCFS